MHEGFSEDCIKKCLEIGQKLLDGVSFDEAYTDELMDGSKSLLFWKDSQSKFLGCNKKFATLGGVVGPRVMIGKYDYELAWREDSGKYRKDDQEVFEFSKPKLNIEESMHYGDGSQKIILTSKFKIYSSNRRKFGLIGIASDITEHKILERKLLEMSGKRVFPGESISEKLFSVPIIEEINRLHKISEYLRGERKKYTFICKNKEIMLSARQLQCVVLILQGKTNKQIGKLLRLSPRTIEYYLNLIKEKFGCETKNHLLEIILSSKGFIDCKK